MAKTTPLSEQDDRLIKRCLPWLRKEQRKKLLPKDIKLLEEIEKVPPEEAFRNFNKLLGKIVEDAKRKRGYDVKHEKQRMNMN